MISDDACAGAGGIFLGSDSLCEDCPPASCGLGAGDCCAANGTAGCEQMDCCSAVCAADPSCCSGSWTGACATQAESLCPACAPPPPNDECASSIAIVDGQTEFDTSTATTDGPAHMEECQFDGQTYNDIWFDYTATCTGNLTVSTCNQSDYDTDLAVYDGCQCPVGVENLLGCNDDTPGCALFSSEVTVGVAADSCYKIRVGGFSAGDSGTGTLSVTCSP